MKEMLWSRIALLTLLAAMVPPIGLAKTTHQDPQKIRADYIARIQQQAAVVPSDALPGSLWATGGALTNLSTDYKASQLNDLITIVVVQKTTAQATGNTTGERDFNTTSGITGLAGHIATSGVSNLLTAQSSTKLKGTGSTDASSTMQTSLTGQVIAVLGNGNLVVEAQRMVTINGQKETMIVRGVVRPGDVSPTNSALSTSLANLEVELKGKGVVSDFNRPPNPFVRALLWLIGF
jgi:flagellar L-ring protein precursor FlgH